MRAAETEASASWGREQVATEKVASLELVLERQRSDFFTAEADAMGEGGKVLAAKHAELDQREAELRNAAAVLDQRQATLDQRQANLDQHHSQVQTQAAALQVRRPTCASYVYPSTGPL